MPTREAPLLEATRRFHEINSEPPPGRRSDVLRADLLAHATRAAHCRYVVITGPAGYGKSTLAAQLAGAETLRPVIWHQVTAGDLDGATFVAHLVALLDRIRPLRPEQHAAMHGKRVALETTLLPALGECIRERSPLYITVDDAHLLTSTSGRRVLEFLMEVVGEDSRLVIAARREPAIAGLARRRVRDEVIEFGPRELAMDLDTATVMLSQMGVEIDGERAALLHRVTEGWPVGLAMAGRITGPASGRAPLDKLTGRHRAIADYFVEEVLSDLDDETRDFLLATSVLRRFSPDLCDAVLERDESAGLIERLERQELFVVPLDDERRWFRYHQLFADLLSDRMQSRGGTDVRRILQRAAEWHEEHGSIDEAVHYAQRSGDMALVGAVVLSHLDEYVELGQLPLVERWLGRSTDAELTSDPALSVATAWVALLLGEAGRAHRFVEAAQRFDLSVPSPDEAVTLESSMLAVRSAVAREGVDQMYADGQRILEIERSGRGRWMIAGCRASGCALILQGLAAEAIPVLEEGLLVCDQHASARYVSVLHLGYLALARIELGDIKAARVLVVEATERIERHGWTEVPEAVPVFAAGAVLALRRGDLGEAHRGLVESARALSSVSSMDWVNADISVRCAEVAGALGQRDVADRFADSARRAIANMPDAGVLPDRFEALIEHLRRAEPGLDDLTPAEARVLQQLATHRTLAEIGERLYISRATVKTHVASIYSKLGVNSRDEAVGRLGIH